MSDDVLYEEDLRENALRMAIGSCLYGAKPAVIVETAKAFEAYIRGDQPKSLRGWPF